MTFGFDPHGDGQMKLTLEPVQIETVCDRASSKLFSTIPASFLRQVNRYQNTLATIASPFN